MMKKEKEPAEMKVEDFVSQECIGHGWS